MLRHFFFFGGGGGGPFFDLLDKSVWTRASLTPFSLLLYNKHVRCSNLQQIDFGAIPSRLDVQKHLDDLFHSAGKASALLSGLGLSHNHSTTSVRTEGYKNLTYLNRNEDCCSYQQPILNNATANMNIPLTRGPIFLVGWLIFMHFELFLPLAQSFMTTSQRRGAWWRNTRKTSA